MLYIGSRIQEYRKKAELSQEEFADKIGVSRQAVSKWERDKAYPDLDRLVCICEILDVQMDELIYGEERKKQGRTDSGESSIRQYSAHEKSSRQEPVHEA